MAPWEGRDQLMETLRLSCAEFTPEATGLGFVRLKDQFHDRVFLLAYVPILAVLCNPLGAIAAC